MYAVFGLGNPDKEYDKTRHNIGFDVIDELASQMGVEVKTKRHKALCGIGNIGGEKVILVKPQTYMNLSGESVRAVMDFYKLDPENDIIVISDDINLATGRIRIRAQGSAGGHNGIKNIILHTGSQNFNRIRVGIDRSKYIKVVDYVLSRFTKDEQDAINQGIENASDAVVDYLDHGFNHAMNRFN